MTGLFIMFITSTIEHNLFIYGWGVNWQLHCRNCHSIHTQFDYICNKFILLHTIQGDCGVIYCQSYYFRVIVPAKGWRHCWFMSRFSSRSRSSQIQMFFFSWVLAIAVVVAATESYISSWFQSGISMYILIFR